MTTFSVKKRLLVGLAAGFVLLVAGAGFWLERRVEHALTEQFDRELAGRARTLIAVTEQEGGMVQLDYDGKMMPEFERETRPDFFQFWHADGSVLYRSSRLEGDLPRSGGPELTMPDGRRGRLVVLRFEPAAEEPEDGEPVPLILAVARGRESLDRLLGVVRWSILGAGAASALLALLLTWRALASGFRPLERVARTVEGLDAERLDERIALREAPLELAPVVEQLNALLTRLQDSFERERRFNANVAHELRTPIAELRSLADVGTRWPEDREAVRRFFGDIGDIAERMEGVIADLLLLARCQAGVETTQFEKTRLSDEVTAAWRRQDSDRRLHIELEEDPVVVTDPGKLAIVLDNLIGNAVQYAAPGAEIRCHGRRAEGGYTLQIENVAREPLADADLARLVEPFWRQDAARSSSDHAGLGLSVVAALAAILGIDVRFAQERDGVFRVVLAGLSIP